MLIRFAKLLLLGLLFSACFNGSEVQPSGPQNKSVNNGSVLPLLGNDVIEQVNRTSANITGRITELGRKPILEHGHTWSTTSDPSNASMITTLGERNNSGTFKSKLINLESDTEYHVRAYAITVVGTVYGTITTLRTNK